jgi:N-acetylneuraminate lyase
MKEAFSGVYAALLTPFDEKGRVSAKKLRALIRFEISKGLNGLYICGSTGEGINMNVDERKQVAEIVSEEARGKVKVIVHVGGSTNTANAVELVKHASRLKLDAVASIPPIYYPFRFDDIFDYYRAIAEASNLPLFIYYIPQLTGGALSNDKLVELGKIQNIIGIKYTAHDFFTLQDLLLKMDNRWIAFSGPDEMFLPALTMGVVGSIGSTQNVIPEIFLEIYRSFKSGDIQRAMQYQRIVTRAVSLLIQYGGMSAWKAALGFRGIDAGFCKPPLRTTLSAKEMAAMKTQWIKILPEHARA